MSKHFIYSFTLVFIICFAQAQSIRKNYLEMAPTEKVDYVSALNAMWAGGSSAVGKGTYFATIHANHFSTNIHSSRGDGSNFTAFHRFMLLHYEMMIRTANSQSNYLCLPYWDWRNDPPKSTALPITPTNNPNFWLFSFLPLSSLPGWGVTRTPATNDLTNLPTSTNYNAVLTSTIFWAAGGWSSPDFTHQLEGRNHNMPHVWVGGNMGTGTSPRDPIFFIHHCMVDRIWQDYEDATVGIQSSFPTPNYIIPSYNKEESWIDNLYAQDCVDSRKIPFRYEATQTTSNYEVWYADNSSVILDGANNTPFSVIGTNKLYRYTAYDYVGNKLRGKMYIGDYKRDVSGAVVADNKGGFNVPAGNSADFRAGEEITIGPETIITAGVGKDVTFKIITAPNGF